MDQTVPTSQIQADFDRIAPLTDEGWNHSSHHYPFLLKHVPDQPAVVLDVGCGTGSFSRLLATRADRVVALDLAQRMIDIAQERSQGFTNIQYHQADVIRWPLPDNHFDCIATIATVHHLPFEETLIRFRSALKTGGVLFILDLYHASGIADRAIDAINVPLSALLKIAKTGRVRESKIVREAWATHGPHDVYPTMAQVRDICQRALPGATVKRHLLWRYSVIWEKPKNSDLKGGAGA